MTDKISSEDFIKAFGGGVKHNLKRPQGDLISREALKNNEPHYDEEGYRVFYESEIDNAQAAEPEYVYLAKVTFDENKLKELTDDIVERIKNGEIVLKDERTNEWTWKPISEPPKEHDYYLVTCEFGAASAIDIALFYPDRKGEEQWSLNYVTAWKPLPEPYESEENT